MLYNMALKPKVRHLVVDSGGFIRNAVIQDIGQKIYTVPEVVGEIRDRATRERLAVLPYELVQRAASAESLRHVTDFARRTGDLGALSAVDLKLAALALDLERTEHGGSLAHLRTEPQVPVTMAVQDVASKDAALPGFYMPKSGAGTGRYSEASAGADDGSAESMEDVSEEPEDQSAKDDAICEGIDEKMEDNGDQEDAEEFEDAEDEDDEEGGWITPSNIRQQDKWASRLGAEDADVAVGVLTTDFAVQNVLMQLGVKVLSVDGLLIHRLKTFVLRCYACFKVTPKVDKVFCPKCGNKTLKRVAVSVSEDGALQYHINFRRPISTRGANARLPKPRGGKHARNPTLTEHTPQPQQRASKKSLQKTNVFADAYMDHQAAPFAARDVTSKAAQLGRAGFRDNPKGATRQKAVVRSKRRKR